MTSYPKSAYGTNPNAGKSPNGASGRGWGSGWPNCQSSKMVKVTNGDHAVNVRREISTLVLTLFKITALRGYDVNPKGEPNQTWGFACRAIANTKTASNHSWGLAVDINAPHNPYSYTFQSNIPPVVVNDWEVCGFYWGGRYTKKFDAMHFEFIGTPAQVAGFLAKAQAILAGLQKPPAKPSKPTGDIPQPKGTVLTMSRIRNCANGFHLPTTDPAYNEVTALLNWCERLTAAGGPPILSKTDGTETWQRAIRQQAYDAAGDYLKACIINLQKRYKLVPDGIFGPKTAAVAAHDGFIIH